MISGDWYQIVNMDTAGLNYNGLSVTFLIAINKNRGLSHGFNSKSIK